MKRQIFCLAVSLVMGAWCAAHAQSVPAALNFNVEVVDSRGNPVAGLTQADFTVQDDKQSAPIAAFQALGASASSQPEEAWIVIDEVNAGFTHVSQARDQIESYLKSHHGALPVPVAVVLVTDTQVLASGTPTRDGAALADEVKQSSFALRSITRAGGFYGAEERTGVSLRALQNLLHVESGRPGRKLVVWVSPGWPYLAYPGTQFSEKSRRSIFAQLVRIRRMLLDSQTTLYAVDPLGTDDAQGFQTTYYLTALKPPRKWQDATTSNIGLQVLAMQSGGVVLNSSNAVANEVEQCLRDAGAYYRLSVPVRASGQPDIFHALRVRVDRPGLKVRTIDGYYEP